MPLLPLKEIAERTGKNYGTLRVWKSLGKISPREYRADGVALYGLNEVLNVKPLLPLKEIAERTGKNYNKWPCPCPPAQRGDVSIPKAAERLEITPNQLRWFVSLKAVPRRWTPSGQTRFAEIDLQIIKDQLDKGWLVPNKARKVRPRMAAHLAYIRAMRVVEAYKQESDAGYRAQRQQMADDMKAKHAHLHKK